MIISPASFKTWADLRPWVDVHVPQAPIFLIEDYLLSAGRDFMRRSQIWRSASITLATTVAGQQDYVYSPPTNAELNRVLYAAISGDEVDVDDTTSDLSEDDGSETSDTFKVGARPTNIVYLTPPPKTSGKVVKGRVSYQLSSSAVGVPIEVYTRWREAVAAGAAALMMRMEGKPWSNPNRARELDRIFAAGCQEAASVGGRVSRLKVRPAPC